MTTETLKRLPPGSPCTNCGKCCTNPGFMGSLQATGNDVKRWRRKGRDDILRFAQVLGSPTDPWADLWIDPRDGEEKERCPFVSKVRNQPRYLCTIYETRPQVCRDYQSWAPGSICESSRRSCREATPPRPGAHCDSGTCDVSEERLDRIEASLAGLATRGDIEVAVATAVAGLATKAELAGIAKNVEITALGHQVLTLTAQMRDLQQRFTAIELRLGGLENRFAAMEGRFAVQEERMTGMLSLLVRVAERIEGPAPPA